MSPQDVDLVSSPPANGLIELSASEIARRIASRDLSSREIVEAFIERIEDVDESLNAVVVKRFDEARAAAKAADEAMQRGETLGELHGVPVTVKECFHVAGTASTIGLTSRKNELHREDGTLVRRLREAGAIVLGKTNVPQLMFIHETDSPVYGRTNNPWDHERNPGGSSGGDAAIVAAGGSPLSLGTDLGGSIRQPCHACGIHGIKPTSDRLPTSGLAGNLHGMNTIALQPGPMAKTVEDLTLAMRVLSAPGDVPTDPNVPPCPFPDPGQVNIVGLRVAMWTDDGYFAASSAIQRAVHEAAKILRSRGAIVESFEPPDVDEAMGLYYALIAADGGNDFRRMLRGSKVDWRLRHLLRTTRIPGLLRPPLHAVLWLLGQEKISRLLAATRASTADGFWQLTHRAKQYRQRFSDALDRGGFDAMIFPPHGLPAMPHELAVYLIDAASYCYLPNLLGIPAGVVAATRVHADEENGRPESRDIVDRLARKTDVDSKGLPVGVQVAARHWREDIVLSIMGELEQGFRAKPDLSRVEDNLA